MRKWMSLAVLAMFGAFATADDKKGTVVELSGLKATTPAGWKEEKPANQLRLMQFKLEKEKGDTEDAELVVFSTPGGGGVEANLKRQLNTFKAPEGLKKEDAVKEDDVKVGEFKGKYQVLKGTYQFKAAPFDPNGKITEKEKYAQLYVIYEDDDKKSISFRVVGPEKTIEKHKKDFEEFIKSFKK
jgi:hypothetical protein